MLANNDSAADSDALEALISGNASDFGALLAEYDRAIGNLTRSHDALLRRVTELTAEVEHKNRLLARQERLAALGEMAAGVAHEIRNPLGGISLYLEMLAREVSGREEAETLCGKIAGAVARLNRIVEAILGFTRPIEPNIRRFAANGFVEEVFGLLRGEAERGEVSLMYVGASDAEALSADPELLHQVLLNLVRNAIEACRRGGAVCVELARASGSETSDAFELRVIDEGSGLPDDATAKLFTPFYTTKKGGTGLGLAFCQRIVEAHGGTISAKNTPSGGACFLVRLPPR